jgi:hypothetical protein
VTVGGATPTVAFSGTTPQAGEIRLASAPARPVVARVEVIEERVQVVNPKERHYVAVVVPLAAGVEVLNPALATAPPEARPSGSLTLAPSYVAFRDDHVAFYYDTLPAGTYDFAFRSRATVAGRFVQPPARAEMMYDGAVWGRSPGARIVVEPKAEEKKAEGTKPEATKAP